MCFKCDTYNYKHTWRVTWCMVLIMPLMPPISDSCKTFNFEVDVCNYRRLLYNTRKQNWARRLRLTNGYFRIRRFTCVCVWGISSHIISKWGECSQRHHEPQPAGHQGSYMPRVKAYLKSRYREIDDNILTYAHFCFCMSIFYFISCEVYNVFYESLPASHKPMDHNVLSCSSWSTWVAYTVQRYWQSEKSMSHLRRASCTVFTNRRSLQTGVFCVLYRWKHDTSKCVLCALTLLVVKVRWPVWYSMKPVTRKQCFVEQFHTKFRNLFDGAPFWLM